MPDMHLLTGAYALDALDDVERAGFERHLRTCGSCAAEVIELQAAAAGLADRVETAPPSRLKAAVLAEVRRTRQISPNERVHLRRPSLQRMLSTAAAAVVIAVTAGLGGVAWQAHKSAEASQIAAEQAAERSAELTQVLTDPTGRKTVQAASVGGIATVVAAAGKAVLAADRLPEPPSGKTYQVWLINGNSVINSAGLLELTNGHGQSLVPGVAAGDTVAVTVEPDGGSKQPTTKPILTIKLA
ncbi:MAG TPA: anti-sigma factor [Kineosporiaceae bacterium]|nr:anti-sigma factor [Kineosporiaceae bacterium]